PGLVTLSLHDALPILRQLPLHPQPVAAHPVQLRRLALNLLVLLPAAPLLLLDLCPYIRRQGCQIAASTHRRALLRRHARAPPRPARNAARAARPVATSPLRITSAGNAFGGSGNPVPRAISRHTSP